MTLLGRLVNDFYRYAVVTWSWRPRADRFVPTLNVRNDSTWYQVQ